MSGDNRKQLSIVSDQSKGFKRVAHERKISACKCTSIRSTSSKSSAGTSNKCRCKDTKSDVLSSKVKMEQLKGSSDVCSKKSITSNKTQ